MRAEPWSPNEPYIVCNASGIVPDTTVVPILLAEEVSARNSLGGEGGVLVDPTVTPDDRGGLDALDHYTRAFLVLGKSGGAGDLTGTFTFKRGEGDDGVAPALLTDLEIPDWATAPMAVIDLEHVLPADFLRLGGTDADDTLLFSFEVTPSEDPAEDVQVIALLYLVPSRGPAFGTGRGLRQGAES